MEPNHQLSFDDLRAANASRANRWNKGGQAPSLDFRLLELAGEAGEACNAGKKLARLKLGMVGGEDTSENLADELADVIISADLAAMEAGVDLAAAVARKFNRTSEKHDFPERLSLGQTYLKAGGEPLTCFCGAGVFNRTALKNEFECSGCGQLYMASESSEPPKRQDPEQQEPITRTCDCEDLRHRQWDPSTGKCIACGKFYRSDRKAGV